VLGNKDLKPEKVTNYELGYRKEIRGGYFGASLFYNKIAGLITTVPTVFAPSPFPAGIPTSSTQNPLFYGYGQVVNFSPRWANTPSVSISLSREHRFALAGETRLSSARAYSLLVSSPANRKSKIRRV
jgi:outer membrane receptor protein involved in Fe transport